MVKCARADVRPQARGRPGDLRGGGHGALDLLGRGKTCPAHLTPVVRVAHDEWVATRIRTPGDVERVGRIDH